MPREVSIEPSPAAHPTTPLQMSFSNETIGDSITPMAKSMIHGTNASNAFCITDDVPRALFTSCCIVGYTPCRASKRQYSR